MHGVFLRQGVSTNETKAQLSPQERLQRLQRLQAALAPLLRQAMRRGLVSAALYSGPWTDVGTPERLTELNE